MDKQRLEKIKAREASATPRPWAVEAGDNPDIDYYVCSAWPDDPSGASNDRVIGGFVDHGSSDQAHANALFTVYARDDIPDLLEHVAALEAVEGALLAYIRDAALSGNLPMLERAADLRPVLAALSVRWPNAIKPQESTPIDTDGQSGA